ncbi:MAG: ATPase [Deltaproteobacteria bacterium]|nr:ATPase [Deltaproteobacteria bacterium]
MAKIAIAGPKGLLQDVLALLQELNTFQIEPCTAGIMEKVDEGSIRRFLIDESSLAERLYLENIRAGIDELFSYLPQLPFRTSYIAPLAIIDVIAKALPRHIATSKELRAHGEELQKELAGLRQHALFLDTLVPLLAVDGQAKELDFIGLEIKNASVIEHLRGLLSSLTDNRFELASTASPDNKTVVLITIDQSLSEKVRTALGSEHIPELEFPSSLSGLSLPAKIAYARKRLADLSSEIKGIDDQLRVFASRWLPIYQKVLDWVNDRVVLLKATASVFETRMCFFVHGWMPAADVAGVRKKLGQAFTGKVVLEEKEVREEDLDLVPVALRNPPYFQPFEIFARLLPLPKYSSFDPTLFIGIFFPVFTGMILGDAGYGMILMAASLFAARGFRKNNNIRDAARILFVSSIHTTLFGILYGEYFGDLGHLLFGLEPVWLERRTSILPMLYLAVTVGAFHVLLGLVLGLVSACRKKAKAGIACKILNLLAVVGIIAIVVSLFDIFPDLLTRPVIIAVLLLLPFLVFTGGLLGPLELIKNIGSIISYARIMAIGLTSVFLAYVANAFAGMTGNIVVGIIVAILLHAVNMVLGVFSPAIHTLRLHYVEFFSKFLEQGGKRFEPFKKTVKGE